MRKFAVFFLVFVLITTSTIPALADNFDWRTSDFTFTYDGVEFHHKPDGTCDVYNQDGTINRTMTNSEVENFFKIINIEFDSFGNVTRSMNLSEQFGVCIANCIGAAGDLFRVSDVTNEIKDFILNNTSHSFTYEYLTNSFKNATVSDDGSISISSDKIDELIYSIKEQISIVTGLWDLKQQHKNEISKADLISRISNQMGCSISYAAGIFTKLSDRGYDAYFYYPGDGSCGSIYAFNTSSYAYCYRNDNYKPVFVDNDFNIIDNDTNLCFIRFNISDLWISDNFTDSPDCYFNVTDRFNSVCQSNSCYNIEGTASCKWFQSASKMYNYINGSVPTYYTASTFNSGNFPDGITLDTTQLSADWITYNNEIIKAIQDATEGITDESERQAKIDEIFKKYLKKINDNLGDINDTIESSSKKTNSILRDILDEIKDFNKDYNNFIKDLEKDFLKDFKKYFKDISDSVKDIAKDVHSIKTLEQLNLLLTAVDALDLDDLVKSIKDDFNAVGDILSVKFPTCIYFDILMAYKLLVAEPVAPVINWDFAIKSIDLVYTVELDFSVFDEYVKWFRSLQDLSYIFILFKATGKILNSGGVL